MAACRVKKGQGGKTEFVNLGSASSASFSVVGESGSESKSRVVLTYSTDVTHSVCKRVWSSYATLKAGGHACFV